MAITERQAIKNWFIRSAMPTRLQFWAWLDSFWHKNDQMPIDNVEGLQSALDDKADLSLVQNLGTGLIYKPSVATVAALTTTYPNAQQGWAALVLADGYIYQYSGSTWNKTPLRAFPDNVATLDDLKSKADVRLASNEPITYFRKEISLEGETDITKYAKQNIHANSVIYDSNGAFYLGTWTYGTIVLMKLEQNTTYILRGQGSMNGANVPAVNLYPSETVGQPRAKGFYLLQPNTDLEFTTDDVNIWVAFYTKVQGWTSGNFDSSETFRLLIKGEVKNKLIDKEGTTLHTFGDDTALSYIGEDASIEEVAIPVANTFENYFLNVVFTDSINAGTWAAAPPTHNAKGVTKLPIEAGFWYTIDMGVDMKGTSFVFGYNELLTNANPSASFWCPISKKASFLAFEGMKSISFYTSMTYAPLGLDFDATTTFKVYKSRKPISGFNTDLGFVDLKQIKGVMDYSDMDNVNIPFPKTFGILRTWDSSKLMSASVRPQKRFELLVDSVYIEGYSEIGFQGNSTLFYPHKNEKHKITRRDKTTKFEFSIGNFTPRNKYHAKAWFTDVLNSNSLVANEMWHKRFATLPESERYPWSTPYSPLQTNFEDRFETGATMHIGGFPVMHFDNGAFIGIKTFQTNTEREDFRMNKNNLSHNTFKHGNTADIILSTVKTSWEELNSDTEGVDIPAERFAILTTWQNNIKNLSASNGDFKAQAHTYIDVQSFIDYYIFCYWIGAFDNWGNNVLLSTLDGVKMYAVLRDLDNTSGAVAPHLIQPSQEFVAKLENFGWGWITPSSTIWKKLSDSFMPEIKARYKYLRDSDIWNAKTFIEAFKEKERQIPYDVLKLNADTWKQILTNRPPTSAPPEGVMPAGGSYNSFKRVYWWYPLRENFMNSKFDI